MTSWIIFTRYRRYWYNPRCSQQNVSSRSPFRFHPPPLTSYPSFPRWRHAVLIAGQQHVHRESGDRWPHCRPNRHAYQRHLHLHRGMAVRCRRLSVLDRHRLHGEYRLHPEPLYTQVSTASILNLFTLRWVRPPYWTSLYSGEYGLHPEPVYTQVSTASILNLFILRWVRPPSRTSLYSGEYGLHHEPLYTQVSTASIKNLFILRWVRPPSWTSLSLGEYGLHPDPLYP